jgi:drug/metabolite transporter (DMT)-like permease
MSSVAFGTALAVCAGLLYNGGVALQSLEARDTPAHWAWRPTLISRLLRRRRWILGSVIGLLGWPLHAVSLLLAPLAVVQPALALGLVLLLVVGGRLGERILVRDWAAVAALVAGVGVLAATAPSPHFGKGPSAWAFVAFALFAVAAATAALLSRRRRLDVRISAGMGGLCFASSGMSTALAAAALHRGDTDAIVGWILVTAVGGGVGLVAEMSALQRFSASRVAPVELAVQIVLPVLLSPVIGAGPIGKGTVGVLVTLVAAAVVTASAVMLLESSGAIRTVIEERPAEPADGPGRGKKSD